MFVKIALPILLYSSKILVFEKFYLIEHVHLKFCKLSLHLKQSMPSCIVYAKLGIYPVIHNAKVCMVSFLFRLLCGKDIKFQVF